MNGDKLSLILLTRVLSICQYPNYILENEFSQCLLIYISKVSRLRWFGCVWRRAIKEPVRKSEVNQLIQVEGTKKGSRRPKIILVEVIKKYMLIWELTKSMTSNRIELRKEYMWPILTNLVICWGFIDDSKKFETKALLLLSIYTSVIVPETINRQYLLEWHLLPEVSWLNLCG